MKKTNSFSTKISRYTEALVLILFGIFILSSCDKVVDYEKPLTENKLVVQSVITAGDTVVNVRITKTLTPYEDVTMPFINYDPRFNVTDAVVKLSFDNGVPFLLELNNNVYYPTTYSKKMKVPYADKCFLEVEHGDQKVYAEAYFPSKTKINYASVIIRDTVTVRLIRPISGEPPDTMVYTKYNYDIEINADFPDEGINYYKIWAGYQFFSDVLNKKIFSPIGYKYFNTSDKQSIKNINFSGRSNYSPAVKLTTGKKALVYLEHISPDYIQFRNAVDDQINNIMDEFNTEIVQIPTNIKGGLGIFTAITRDSIWADITIK